MVLINNLHIVHILLLGNKTKVVVCGFTLIALSIGNLDQVFMEQVVVHKIIVHTLCIGSTCIWFWQRYLGKVSKQIKLIIFCCYLTAAASIIFVSADLFYVTFCIQSSGTVTLVIIQIMRRRC